MLKIEFLEQGDAQRFSDELARKSVSFMFSDKTVILPSFWRWEELPKDLHKFLNKPRVTGQAAEDDPTKELKIQTPEFKPEIPKTLTSAFEKLILGKLRKK